MCHLRSPKKNPPSFYSQNGLDAVKIHTNHVSLFISPSFSKYCIALYCPISRCFFWRVKIVPSTFATEKERLFPKFVASVCAITLGCNKQELSFLRAFARMAGFWTVQKCCCRHIPVWWRRSTQSSILSPNPPQIFCICQVMCLSIKCTLGVMVQRSAAFLCTAACTYRR